MKRLLFMAVALLVSIASFGKAINLGSYTMAGKEYEVYLNDGLYNRYYFINVMGETEYEHVNIVLNGEESYVDFVAALRMTRDKYAEWTDVAKENHVEKVFKEFPAEFPEVTIGWKGMEQYYAFHQGIKMCFSVLAREDGTIGYNMMCGGTATSSDNKYITQKWYLIFFNLNELDSLIKVLDPVNVQNALNGETEADMLFK